MPLFDTCLDKSITCKICVHLHKDLWGGNRRIVDFGQDELKLLLLCVGHNLSQYLLVKYINRPLFIHKLDK